MLSNKENTSCVIDKKDFNCTKKEFKALNYYEGLTCHRFESS